MSAQMPLSFPPVASGAKWNPYFLAYCEEHGRSPEAQLDHDRERWPGGLMAGFILWIEARWAEVRAALCLRRNDPITADHHDQFAAWLATRAWRDA